LEIPVKETHGQHAITAALKGQENPRSTPDKPQAAMFRPSRVTVTGRGFAMKRLFSILIVSFALVMTHDFNRSSAQAKDIPLKAGSFSVHQEGSLTLCLKPDFSDVESCSAVGAVPTPFNDAAVGQFTQDKAGNSCDTLTSTLSFSGGDPNPRVTVLHVVGTVTVYDPATGVGDGSTTAYVGGKCTGSTFDKTGATLDSTATDHFVFSDGGKRSDFVVTSLSNPAGSIGGFALSGFGLQQ
jgi:hypothetical protein